MRNVRQIFLLIITLCALTMSGSASAQERRGGHAILASGYANLVVEGGYAFATSTCAFWTDYPGVNLSPVYAWATLEVDGQMVYSAWTVVSSDYTFPSVLYVSWQYYVGPGVHTVRFVVNDDCEVIDDAILFFDITQVSH